MPQDVKRMINVVNVRKNWGKLIKESRKRNKSKGPVRSPDWYAGRYDGQTLKYGEWEGYFYHGSEHNRSVFLGSKAGVL